uniref:Large ribosomal subunit protein mL53 n=1 Tax=Dicentrarchus labrax TaxID=13489 RepID=A0A8C4HQ69_DICLA
MAAPSKATVVLKAVKKIAIQFSPFESNVRSTREFLVLVGSEKARATNRNCEVVTMVKHDKSEPVVDVTYRKYYLTTFKCVGEDIFYIVIVAGVLRCHCFNPLEMCLIPMKQTCVVVFNF